MSGLHHKMTEDLTLLNSIRAEAKGLPESGLVSIFAYGQRNADVIPLWAGEGDLPTPDFICDAAAEALRAGHTFYTHQRGIPDLREALAGYTSSLYGMPFEAEQFFVTTGAMQAINVAIRMTTGAGDHVVIPTPAWPNFAAATEMVGATPRYVPMDLTPDGWRLDLDRLFDACRENVSALVINSPANPTGWSATASELKAILEMARTRGIWIIADEIYGRFYYDGDLAPSFLAWREPDDRLLFVNTFSKNWAMTGWRLGWLQAPPALGQIIENLVQYKSMGVATALQWAGVAAIRDGESFVRSQIKRATEGREIVCDALSSVERAVFSKPDGAFYLLFRIDGYEDSMKTAMQIIDEASVGLAPGSAFGPGGEGHFRICFANSPDRLRKAMDRLTAWLRTQA